MRVSKKNRNYIVLLSLLGMVFIFCFGIYLFLYEDIAINRKDLSLEKNLQEYKSAGICLITATNHDGITAYSVGASGVIFAFDGSGYYALTANHVVNKKESEFLIRTINDVSLEEYKKIYPDLKAGEVSKYYKTLSRAQVLYKSQKEDLAIIYFKNNTKLASVKISDKNPLKGEHVVCLGTYSKKAKIFMESYGTVESDKVSSFRTMEESQDNQVLKHNAFVDEGFSGSGVFNKKMEIVGITIGGGKNIFGRFAYGVMIPCEAVKKVVKDSHIFIED